VSHDENIVSLDLGTSSVRAFLFNSQFESLEDFGAQIKYRVTTTPDGGVEIDPDLLLKMTCDCLDILHAQMKERGKKAHAVGISTFWHCFVGIDGDARPTAPIIHLFDTRSQKQVRELRDQFDPNWLHSTTGCMPHTSYWPAKLMWLREAHGDAFHQTARWLSVGEFLLLKLTGQTAESISMVSASGLWDRHRDDYCDEVLDFVGVQRSQLAPVDSLDEPLRSLGPDFAERWPLWQGIPWYPACGDGACNNVGSGCTAQGNFALMVGTSGAIRVVVKQRDPTIPYGLWCYRVSRERSILGGAVSNGGGVFGWATRTLNLPPDAEGEMVKREPGSHGLTVLPFLSGERSPYWRSDLRAMITGISLSTTPVEILQAMLESVALRFKQIYDLLKQSCGEPIEVIASGGALMNSPVWLRMMTDAIGHPIKPCLEAEASSRGAVILTAERMGLISDMEKVSMRLGEVVEPDRRRIEIYQQLLARNDQLFHMFYKELPVSLQSSGLPLYLDDQISIYF
jgi:gluconokinase